MIKVVKYGAPWCGPCVGMDVILEQLSETFPDIEIESVDISKPENEYFIRDLKIVSIPTIIIYKDEEIVSKNTGAMSYPSLVSLVESALKV